LFKRIPFILLNFIFLYNGTKISFAFIFHLYILEFLYTTTLRVVLVKFFLDLGNSYLVFIVFVVMHCSMHFGFFQRHRQLFLSRVVATGP
jgi:hypothetical protein